MGGSLFPRQAQRGSLEAYKSNSTQTLLTEYCVLGTVQGAENPKKNDRDSAHKALTVTKSIS